MKTNRVAQQLKKYLKDTQLKQRQLSTMIGVSVFTLNRWIKGHNVPHKYHQRLIEKELKISLDISQ